MEINGRNRGEKGLDRQNSDESDKGIDYESVESYHRHWNHSKRNGKPINLY